jgi:hypothetical protein
MKRQYIQGSPIWTVALDCPEPGGALTSKQIEDRVFGAIGRSSSEVHKYAL